MADIDTIWSTLRENFFDPQTHSARDIPDCPGNYIFCLRTGSALPSINVEPHFTLFEGLRVIYTGISSKSLRGRDFKKHLTGNNAGQSTLRKSLGVMFGYRQIPRDKNPFSGKTKFGLSDEQRLTAWMLANLVMYYLPNQNPGITESIFIQHFNPPLNLQGNSNRINAAFRARLSALRSDKG